VGRAKDALMVVRCLYCLTGIEFIPMIAYKDGRFVCRNCAHTVRPGVPEYRCTCRAYLRLSRKGCDVMASFIGGRLVRC
jgi:hypothetical protein